MSTNTNTELLEFFKWWLQEAESATPCYEVMAYGLCYNTSLVGLDMELQDILKDTFFNTATPFNTAEHTYSYESDADRMHLNPRRVAFVKAQIELMEKLQSANQE